MILSGISGVKNFPAIRRGAQLAGVLSTSHPLTGWDVAQPTPNCSVFATKTDRNTGRSAPILPRPCEAAGDPTRSGPTTGFDRQNGRVPEFASLYGGKDV